MSPGTTDSFDYSRYTLDQLLDARAHIDRETYAERAAEIDAWITRRRAECANAAQAAGEQGPFLAGGRARSGRHTPIIVFGVIAFILCLVAVSAVVIAATRAWTQSNASREAARRVVLGVVSEWNAPALEANASDEFKKVLTPATLDGVFTMFRKLGKFRSLGEPTGGAKVALGVGAFRSGVTAEYSFPATFANGEATIRIALVYEASSWRVNGFFVNSDVLVRP